MYYSMNGGYRKTKIFIDYANVVLTAAIIIMAGAILLLRDGADILFPLIFLAGAADKILLSVKWYIAGKQLKCGVSAGAGVLLLVLAGLCMAAVS